MTYDEAYERFDDYLDEDGPFKTGFGSGYTELRPSRALRTTDRIAYRTSFNDWADSEGIDTDELEGEDHR